jgi:polyhydroxyalkanoate synthesis repressor PhaR
VKKKTSPAPAPRLIKRYDNRKLYDAADRRYVTLEHLAGMVARGEDVRVVDQKSGDDLTNVVFTQVILERMKQRTADVPRQVLARLIRLGSAAAPSLAGWVGPHEAAARARDEAEKIVSRMIGRGRLSLEEALALRQEIAHSVHRIVAEAQQGLESRIRGLLERPDKDGLHPSLQTLKERLLALESYLVEPPPRRNGGRRRVRRGARGERPRPRA